MCKQKAFSCQETIITFSNFQRKHYFQTIVTASFGTHESNHYLNIIVQTGFILIQLNTNVNIGSIFVGVTVSLWPLRKMQTMVMMAYNICGVLHWPWVWHLTCIILYLLDPPKHFRIRIIIAFQFYNETTKQHLCCKKYTFSKVQSWEDTTMHVLKKQTFLGPLTSVYMGVV